MRFLNWASGDALDELLTHAMLFVLPSDLEGLSLALLDAMGAGVCVFTSDIPENREVVEGAGFTFRPGDAYDLERMLRLLINEPEVRRSAAKLAQQRIRERYLWPRIAKDIEQVYWHTLGCPDTSGATDATPVRDGRAQNPRRSLSGRPPVDSFLGLQWACKACGSRGRASLVPNFLHLPVLFSNQSFC